MGDPVVEEIDVELIFPRGEMYTLDYPIPSVANKYFHPNNVKVRPMHSMLEIEYDTSEWIKSQFFNKDFVSGSGANIYSNRKFLSTKVNMRSQYACGQIRNGTLYLSPVSQRLAMRPDFSHIDRANSSDASPTINNSNGNNESYNINNRKDSSKVGSSSSVNNTLENNNNDNDNKSMVRVQIKKMQNAHSMAVRERAYSTLMLNKSAEKWVELDVVDNEQANTLSSLNKDIVTAGSNGNNNNTKTLQFDVSPPDYLSAIAPAPKKKISDFEDMRRVKGYVPPSSSILYRGGKNEMKKKGSKMIL